VTRSLRRRAKVTVANQPRAPRAESKLLPASPVGRATGKWSEETKGRRWAGRKLREDVRSEERISDGVRGPDLKASRSVPILPLFSRRSATISLPAPGPFLPPSADPSVPSTTRNPSTIPVDVRSEQEGAREGSGRYDGRAIGKDERSVGGSKMLCCCCCV
jgi:hypothetical protein